MSDVDDFGPWPQPPPGYFEDGAPAVVHLPEELEKDWSRKVGRRYAKQMLLETPGAMLWARKNPGLVPVSDRRFCEIVCDGIFSKFLTPRALFDPPDESHFAAYLGRPLGAGEAFYKSDFTPMRQVPSDADSATSPSVVLFRRDASRRYHLVAIALNDEVFDPSFPEAAWVMAKYFALQGAGVLTTLLMHPKLHFPSNSIDAVTRTRLSDGPLKRLLLPHFRLALGVNKAVLYGERTVLEPGRLYAPYPGSLKEHGDVVATLWRGFSHPDGTPNRAYPRYRMSLEAPVVHSPYGDFLGHYFDLLLRLGDRVTEPVVAAEPKDVSAWADHCAQWVPGFPDSSAIYRDGNLARVFASLVTDIAVGHSADHYQYSLVNLREVPFRLHAPVPTRRTTSMPARTKLTTWRDNFNYEMCMRLFFAPHVVLPMSEVDYRFESAPLRAAAADFQTELRSLQSVLAARDLVRYLPLPQLASSVQY